MSRMIILAAVLHTYTSHTDIQTQTPLQLPIHSVNYPCSILDRSSSYLCPVQHGQLSPITIFDDDRNDDTAVEPLIKNDAFEGNEYEIITSTGE